jgi:hypothetical protein
VRLSRHRAGQCGRVINSSVKAGETLSGTVSWTVSAPGAQTITFQLADASPAFMGPDAAGNATAVFETTALPNSQCGVGVTIDWVDGTTTTVPIGEVTIYNAPPPPTAVMPPIGKPVITPGQPLAGTRITVTFAVTRSDNGRPLTRGKMNDLRPVDQGQSDQARRVVP